MKHKVKVTVLDKLLRLKSGPGNAVICRKY